MEQGPTPCTLRTPPNGWRSGSDSSVPAGRRSCHGGCPALQLPETARGARWPPVDVFSDPAGTEDCA
eukprot:3288387-Lingulodinium_polyedra.AAC.1